MQQANLGLLGYKEIQDFLPFASGFNEILIGFDFVTLVILGLIFFLDTRQEGKPILRQGQSDMCEALGSFFDRMEFDGLDYISKWDYCSF